MSPELKAAIEEVEVRIAPLTRAEWMEKHPGEHLDFNYRGRPSCLFCGLMKPRAGWTKDCRGVTRIALR